MTFRGGPARQGVYDEGAAPAECRRAAWKVDLRLPKGHPRLWRTASAPVAVHGLVVVGGLDFTYSAHDPVKGAQRWTFVSGISDAQGELVSPWVHAERIGVGTAKGFATLDPATGAPLHTDLGAPLHVSPVRLDDGDLVCATTQHLLRVRTDGAVQWSLALPERPTRLISVHQGTVFVRCVRPEGLVIAADLATGAERWRASTGQVGAAGVAVAEGLVLATTGESAKLVALDAADGAVRWEWKASSMTFGTPAVANGLAVFGAMYGRSPDTLHAIELATGKPRWRFEAQSHAANADASICGADAFAVLGGKLCCLELETGKERWRVENANKFSHPPELHDATAYVTTTHHLLAFRAPHAKR